MRRNKHYRCCYLEREKRIIKQKRETIEMNNIKKDVIGIGRLGYLCITLISSFFLVLSTYLGMAFYYLYYIFIFAPFNLFACTERCKNLGWNYLPPVCIFLFSVALNVFTAYSSYEPELISILVIISTLLNTIYTLIFLFFKGKYEPKKYPKVKKIFSFLFSLLSLLWVSACLYSLIFENYEPAIAFSIPGFIVLYLTKNSYMPFIKFIKSKLTESKKIKNCITFFRHHLIEISLIIIALCLIKIAFS